MWSAWSWWTQLRSGAPWWESCAHTRACFYGCVDARRQMGAPACVVDGHVPSRTRACLPAQVSCAWDGAVHVHALPPSSLREDALWWHGLGGRSALVGSYLSKNCTNTRCKRRQARSFSLCFQAPALLCTIVHMGLLTRRCPCQLSPVQWTSELRARCPYRESTLNILSLRLQEARRAPAKLRALGSCSHVTLTLPTLQNARLTRPF